MRIIFKNSNRKIVLAECVWHGFWKGGFITPTIRFDYLGLDGWTFDICWLKLYITFGYLNLK